MKRIDAYTPSEGKNRRERDYWWTWIISTSNVTSYITSAPPIRITLRAFIALYIELTLLALTNFVSRYVLHFHQPSSTSLDKVSKIDGNSRIAIPLESPSSPPDGDSPLSKVNKQKFTNLYKLKRFFKNYLINYLSNQNFSSRLYTRLQNNFISKQTFLRSHRVGTMFIRVDSCVYTRESSNSEQYDTGNSTRRWQIEILVKSSTVSNDPWRIPFGTSAGIRFSHRWEASSLHNDLGGGGGEGSIVHPRRIPGGIGRASVAILDEKLLEVIVCDSRENTLFSREAER